MRQKIKRLQGFYVVTIVISLIFISLEELEWIPTEYIGNDAKVLYWVNLYSIVTGLGGMFVTLRWFNFKYVLHKVQLADEALAFSSFCKWSAYRLLFLAVVLLSNVLLYQASSYTSTPMYCMLITYVAYVFCWPSMSAFLSLRNK